MGCFKGISVRRNPRFGTGPRYRTALDKVQSLACPPGRSGKLVPIRWNRTSVRCLQDGDPATERYRGGVNIEDRTRTCAFTVRRADHYTMLTIVSGVPSTNRTPYAGLQPTASPFGLRNIVGTGVEFRSHAKRVWSPLGQPWLTREWFLTEGSNLATLINSQVRPPCSSMRITLARRQGIEP